MNTSTQNNSYEKNEVEIFRAPKDKNKKFRQPSFFLLMIKDSLAMVVLFLIGWLIYSE